MSELFDELMHIFGNRKIADNSKSTVFNSNWKQCVTCGRKPVELAILNKHDEILCCIHRHHDHTEEYLWELCDKLDCNATWLLEGGRQGPPDPGWNRWLTSLGELIVRFQETAICSFCNEAEGKAKKIIGTHKHFSFSPYEMALFIDAPEPGPVIINKQKAMEIWDSQRENVEYRKKLADRIIQLAFDGKIGMIDVPLLSKQHA